MARCEAHSSEMGLMIIGVSVKSRSMARCEQGSHCDHWVDHQVSVKPRSMARCEKGTQLYGGTYTGLSEAALDGAVRVGKTGTTRRKLSGLSEAALDGAVRGAE